MAFRPFRRKRSHRRHRYERERYPQRSAPDAQLERVATRRQLLAPVRPSGPEWGPLTKLSENVRVQATKGSRAAVVELKPGLYLVGEVPESALKPEVGLLPLLAPLLIAAATKALKRKGGPGPHQVPMLPGPKPAPWIESEDLAEVAGFDGGCGCRHRT